MDIASSIGIGGIVICSLVDGGDPSYYDNFTFKGALIASVVFLAYGIIKQQKARDDERKFYETKISNIVDQKNQKLIEQQQAFINYQQKCDLDSKTREKELLNHITMSNEKIEGLHFALDKVTNQLDNLNNFFEKHISNVTNTFFQAALNRFNLLEDSQQKQVSKNEN